MELLPTLLINDYNYSFKQGLIPLPVSLSVSDDIEVKSLWQQTMR